jgi:hypothetical protein
MRLDGSAEAEFVADHASLAADFPARAAHLRRDYSQRE